MKSKILIVILSISCLFCLAFGLSSCKHENSEHVHDWNEWTVVAAPDCGHKGVQVRICKLDSTHSDSKEIAALEHKWDGGEVIAEADCKNYGLTLFTCENDSSHTKLEKIEKLGHIFDKIEYIDFYTHEKTCKECLEIVIEKHDFNVSNKCESCEYSMPYTKSLGYKLSEDETYYSVYAGDMILSEDKKLVVPYYYNGKPVTTVSSFGFQQDGRIKEVFLPESITTLESSAFSLCKAIEKLYFPESLKFIGSHAFFQCLGLESLYIPDGVTTIEKYAFGDCRFLKKVYIGSGLQSVDVVAFSINNLEEITVSEDNKKFHSETNCLIETTSKTLIRGCKNSVIPDDGSVKIIGRCAFEDCSGLTDLVIPNNVEIISYKAFSGCAKLKSIVIGSSIKTIERAFYSCISLKKVHYEGTAEQLEKVHIIKSGDNYGINNMYLINADWYFYSENPPTIEGNFWHYENGEVVVWIKET